MALADFRGRPSVVNFFASWCRKYPAGLQSAFGTLKVQTADRMFVVGEDSNDTNPTQARFLLATAKAIYPVGSDHDTSVGTSYLPVSNLLDVREEAWVSQSAGTTVVQ